MKEYILWDQLDDTIKRDVLFCGKRKIGCNGHCRREDECKKHENVLKVLDKSMDKALDCSKKLHYKDIQRAFKTN
jgi:hypothetical protein